MKKLTPINLDDGTVIYMEVKEDIELVPEEPKVDEATRELTSWTWGMRSRKSAKMLV